MNPAREFRKSINDISVRWVNTKSKRTGKQVRVAFLDVMDPNMGDITSLPVSIRIAAVLVEYGMSSGS